MSTITKEQAKDLRNAFQCWQQDYDPAEDKEQYDMFGLGVAAIDALLASLEAEPAIHRWRRVTVEPYGPYPWHYGNFIGFSKPVEGIEDEYFYSAPPAPVVPQEATPENIAILASTFAPRGVTYQWDSDECNAAADSWNACRAAMLQGAEQTNYRAIVERIAEIVHGKITDIDLLTVTVKSMKDNLHGRAEPVTTAYKLPMQPLVIDAHGTLRFKENPIVRKLLDYATEHGYGLNEIALDEFEAEDQMQLAQLIGYSLSGYGTLSYVTDESYDRAAAAAPQQEVKS